VRNVPRTSPRIPTVPSSPGYNPINPLGYPVDPYYNQPPSTPNLPKPFVHPTCITAPGVPCQPLEPFDPQNPTDWVEKMKELLEEYQEKNQEGESCPAPLADQDDDDDDDTISIWKAPRVGQSERLLREGFHPDDFPSGIVNGELLDGSAYFAREREFAESFARDDDHDQLLLEVQIPEDVYNSRLESGRIEEHEYFRVGEWKPIGTEVVIPSSEFDMLNNANRILHEVN
jgi:hypothetical protein